MPGDLPERVVCKLALGADSVMAAFYENEVKVYTRLRPELLVEAPRSLGALYDPQSASIRADARGPVGSAARDSPT